MVEFVLHLSNPAAGFGKPRIAAIPAVYAGTYDTESREILKPDATAVRDALPYRWRKAFDRATHFWFGKDSRVDESGRHNGPVPHLELRDYRGRWINTVYAIPCRVESVA